MATTDPVAKAITDAAVAVGNARDCATAAYAIARALAHTTSRGREDAVRRGLKLGWAAMLRSERALGEAKAAGIVGNDALALRWAASADRSAALAIHHTEPILEDGSED